MKIIALIGGGSCGKTTTINLVYHSLISKGAISSNRKQEGGNLHDFSDVLKFGNKTIAFLSMGDYSYRVIECILDFERQGCDIFICACNNRFARPFKEFAKRNAVILDKTIASNPNQWASANDSDAQIILNLI